MRAASGGAQDLLKENFQAQEQGKFAGPNDDTLNLISTLIGEGDPEPVQKQQTDPAKVAAPSFDDYDPASTGSPYDEYKKPVDMPPDDLVEAMARASEDDNTLQAIPGHEPHQPSHKVDPMTGAIQNASVDDLLKQSPKKVYSADSITNVILSSVPQIGEQRAHWLAARIIEAHDGDKRDQ